MKACLYDPRIGRFFSPDNYITDAENPQSYNRYSYALNNPLSYVDPSGNSAYSPYNEPFDGTACGFGDNVLDIMGGAYSEWADAALTGSMEDYVFGYSNYLAAVAHQNPGNKGGGGSSNNQKIGDILDSFVKGIVDGVKFWNDLNESTKNTILKALNEYCEVIKKKMKDGEIYEVWGIIYQYETVDDNNNPILAQGVEFHIGKNNSPEDVWNTGEVTHDASYRDANGNIIEEPVWKEASTFIYKDKDLNQGALPIAEFHFHAPSFAVAITDNNGNNKRFVSSWDARNYKNTMPFSGGKPSNTDYNGAGNRNMPYYIFCQPNGSNYDNYWYIYQNNTKIKVKLPWP